MVLPKLVDYHINRLKDKNPDVRLKAIRELELLGDAGALEALKSVFEQDEDVDVRKAAQEAGRVIFLKHKQQGATNSPATP
ncbi:MAG: HEAT repeat domain-containing protein [bacterium]|nr:HEAT repeat domain-containing protein [bacterium]